MFKESTWKEGEKTIQDFMKKQGYKIIYTNFSCVGVELDIVAILPRSIQIRRLKREFLLKIACDKVNKKMYKASLKAFVKAAQDILVITEVKSRESDKFGMGLEAISEHKKQNLIRGARFLQKDKRFENLQLRFDIASVDAGSVTYIEDAF